MICIFLQANKQTDKPNDRTTAQTNNLTSLHIAAIVKAERNTEPPTPQKEGESSLTSFICRCVLVKRGCDLRAR
jgi:hypothetical protein